MSGFDYINARVAAMRASLLGAEEIEGLLEAGGPEDVTARLLNTSYNSALADSLRSYDQREAIDHAFNEVLRQDLTRILSFAGLADRDLLKLMVSNWDAQALKCVLRGVHNRVSPDDILGGIGPLLDISDDQIKMLASEPHPNAVISMLATWGSEWAPPLLYVLADYEETKTIQKLEYALDKYRFQQISLMPAHPEKSTAIELLAQEAELKNIIHALTLVGKNMTPNLLPQPGRSLKTVHAICNCERQADAMAVLSETSYQAILDKALPMMLMAKGHYGMLERLLDETVMTIARRKSLEDPLSIAVPYYYLLLRHNEIMNLRLITNGITSGMQKNALRAALILPGAA